MESVWLPHPDVWATKISSVLIALRLGQISTPIALNGLAYVESQYVIQPALALCQLCSYLVFKGVRAP